MRSEFRNIERDEFITQIIRETHDVVPENIQADVEAYRERMRSSDLTEQEFKELLTIHQRRMEAEPAYRLAILADAQALQNPDIRMEASGILNILKDARG